MCNNPRYIAGHVVPCRECQYCIDNKTKDWAGKCMAEHRTATAGHSVTLTYGRDENGSSDHIRAAMLMYEDVQKYFKRLRFDGYKFRYLIAGEYGSKKRRAHWHMLIFWESEPPEVELNKERWMGHTYWPHGFTFWESFEYRSVWYVCKYAQKEQGDNEAEAMMSASKKPPLGYEWFNRYAEMYVRQGLPVKSLHYSFDGENTKEGKRRQFYMKGVTAENFLNAYLWYYLETGRSIKEMPYSEVVEQHMDKLYRHWFELENVERQYGYEQKAKAIEIAEKYAEAAAPYGGVHYVYIVRGDIARYGYIVYCRDIKTRFDKSKFPETQTETIREILLQRELYPGARYAPRRGKKGETKPSARRAGIISV
jgi:hypothetical protein